MAGHKQNTKIMAMVRIKSNIFNLKNYLHSIYEYNNDYTNIVSEMTEPVFFQQVCQYQLVVTSKTNLRHDSRQESSRRFLIIDFIMFIVENAASQTLELANTDSISRKKCQSLRNFSQDSISQKSSRDSFFSIEKKDPTEVHTIRFEDRMFAGSLQYPSAY
jgi:hypothetical protein